MIGETRAGRQSLAVWSKKLKERRNRSWVMRNASVFRVEERFILLISKDIHQLPINMFRISVASRENALVPGCHSSILRLP
jgi:hypothetical protein